MPPDYPTRFEWERTLATNQWVNLIRGLPADSPLFAHNGGCPRLCTDAKGRPRLRPGTLKQVAITAATYARPDGTDVHPGIDALADACGRARSTAAAGLAHLEAVGLLICRARAGQSGIPRWHASVYHLSTPPPGQLAGILPPDEETRLHDWFQRPPGDSGTATA